MSWKDTALGRSIVGKKHVRTPEERALVRRLDIVFMGFGFASQVIKYLDQTNINNAYISGMKEDLGLFGNELNLFTTFFNIGYILMLIPSQIIMTYVRPSIWLSGMEVGWGILTGLFATVHSANQVYALRFFVGLLEAGCWPGMMTLFMYWYTPTEIAKRMAIYHSARECGAMMSGALQVAILHTLDGAKGIAGWRWLFVVNSLMTVVLGVIGFFAIPDSPNDPNPLAKWLSKDQAQLANKRLDQYGRARPGKITLASAKRSLSKWIVWFIPLLFWCAGLAVAGNSFFGVFLKSLKDTQGKPIWSVDAANSIPIGASAVTVVTLWVWGTISDVFQIRWQLLAFESLVAAIPGIIMTIWTRQPLTTPLSAAYASYFISFMCGGGSVLLLSWASDLLPDDPDSRSFIVSICVTGIYSIQTGAQVGMWPAKDAPYFRAGWPTSLAFSFAHGILVLILRYLDVRYLRPKKADQESSTTVVESSASNEQLDTPTNEKTSAEVKSA
ncbi:major facilitator superfamily domain-containing protein [Rhypophila decipiens]|uniref:Major facilitator superfamily domain-containing protein n=1 Tax=Rhypophila decipiens TaxID=261697 RepID=A0AAN6Y0W8_9PEZI|nr:major facilitator superfamily domain-containing protein [Rhypophila decipiens]